MSRHMTCALFRASQGTTCELAGKAKDTVNGLPPHIYLVAANAFRKMVRERQSQSLIVNGESGAGKTETTKKAMQYFATLAGGTGVEDQVLEVGQCRATLTAVSVFNLLYLSACAVFHGPGVERP